MTIKGIDLNSTEAIMNALRQWMIENNIDPEVVITMGAYYLGRTALDDDSFQEALASARQLLDDTAHQGRADTCTANVVQSPTLDACQRLWAARAARMQPSHDHRLRHVRTVGVTGHRPPCEKRASGLPIDHNRRKR
jgi:hypothetical protein